MSSRFEVRVGDGQSTESKAPLLISEDEAGRRIRVRIEQLVREVRKPFHLSRLPRVGFHLFTIGDSEFGEIFPDSRVHEPVTAFLERKKLEDVGEEAMAQYGFDPSEVTVLNRCVQTGGISTEHRRYPSKLVKGLDFEGYFVLSAAGKPIQATWCIRDNAPVINLRPNRKPAVAPAR